MELNVKVNKCCYRKEDTGWSILMTNKGTCKGTIHWIPEVGDLLILNGTYKKYQGINEFAFNLARQDIPIDPHAQLKLVCDLTPRMGKSNA